MALKSGYFNSINGDRKYNADDMSNYFDGLIQDGIYLGCGNRFAVTAPGASMFLYVETGRAIMNCRWVSNDDVYITGVDPGGVQDRIDALYLHLDMSRRLISLGVKKGEEAAAPVPPVSPYNKDDTDGPTLYIAKIYVKARSTSISNADITDLRGSAYCPWVSLTLSGAGMRRVTNEEIDAIFDSRG